MTKNYYKNEYSVNQWRNLIDTAVKLGVTVTYSIYGNIATLDSTETEDDMMISAAKRGGNASREFWADTIHDIIQRSAEGVK